MNKIRLNQILQILTIPYTNKKLGQKDDLKRKIEAYCIYLEDIQKFNFSHKTAAEKAYMQAREDYVLFMWDNIQGSLQSLDDFLLIGEKFFPENRIFFFMDQYHQNVSDMTDYLYVDNIFQIADSLLTTRDGIIAIRTWKNKPAKDFPEDIFGTSYAFNKVEIWNALTRIMPTDVFIAAFVVLNRSDYRLLYRQHATISLADKLLIPILEKGIAETHLHRNATVDYQMIWEKVMDFDYWRDSEQYPENINFKEEHLIWAAFLYRIITLCYMENFFGEKEYIHYITDEFKEIKECFADVEKPLWKSDIEKQVFLRQKFSMLDSFLKKYKLRKFEIGFGLKIYSLSKQLHTSTELIFMVKSLFKCRDIKSSSFFRFMFLQYIRIKSTFYQNFLQQNSIPGLGWFHLHFQRASKIFRESFLDDKKQWEAIIKNQMFMPYLKKLEIRCALDFDKPIYESENELLLFEMKKRLLKEIKNFLEVYKAIVDANSDENIVQIGLILHFNKRGALDNTSGFFCWRMYQDKNLFDSNHILALRRKYVFLAHAVAEIRNEIPYLDEYIVGLDAASNENNAEPWIFAPAFNRVRERKYTHGVREMEQKNDIVRYEMNNEQEIRFKHMQNIGLTYHVGEDFRHLLSGLRHIDEVIEKFNYKSCDRLGHAIALGVDIDYWVRCNSNIVLPRGEHLDNLLWLWGILGENTCHISFSTLYLEKSILDCAKEIYQNMNGITVYLLYQAYQRKFYYNLTQEFEKCNPTRKENNDKVCPYKIDEINGVSVDEQRRWTVEELVCSFFCPFYIDRYNQVIWQEISKDDIPWLEEVQRYVLEKVQKRGIYVETNPTSNLAIGAIEGLYMHHMIRMNVPGTIDKSEMNYHVMATVNSDDSAVFNTNVENELAYVYHSLIDKGYSSEIIVNWIDKIRQYGMDSSFIKKEKKRREIQKEISEILVAIENYDFS